MDSDQEPEVTAAAEPKKRGGWPKGKPRTARVSSVGGDVELRSEPVRSTPRRQRTIRGGDVQDKYYVPPHLIPPGQSWEWKRVSTYGATDPSYDVFLRGQGWEPVQAHQAPGLVPDGHKGPIIRDGQMLCERPIELTMEARQEDIDRAKGVIRAKERQLGEAGEGQFERKEADGRSAVRVSKSYSTTGMPVDQ